MDLFKSVAHYIKNTDLYLAVIAFLCSGYGMALIYSATLHPVSVRDDGSTKNLYVQGAAILLGFAAFVFMSLIDLEGIKGKWKHFVVVNIALQLLLFTPLGMEVNGQRAWLNLGVTSLQPGELGKLIFIFTIAAHISEVGDYISDLRGLTVIALHTLLMMGAVVVSSGDSGMAIQYFMIAVIMLFAAGLSLKWIALGAVIGVASIPVLWNFVLKKYQITRILVLFDPAIDPQAALQTTYGKIAIGSGQLTGQGLTHGTHDAAPVRPGEPDRLHLFGRGGRTRLSRRMAIILLLTLLIALLFYVSYRASTPFSSLLAVGVAGMFLFQTFMNIFMNVGLLPVMGLTLPFFSYGGTSVLTMYAALGIAAGVRMREKPSWLQN